VIVEDAHPGLGTDRARGATWLAGEGDRLLDGLSHRKIEVQDEGVGERLRAGFDALGWWTTRLAWMLRPLAGGPPDPGAGGPGGEVDPAAIRGLREEWLTAEPGAPDGEEIQRFLEVEDRVARIRPPVRCLAVVEDGAPVGFVRLMVAGEMGEVVDVYTTPAHRGHGHGRALVAAALADAAAAGAREALIVADDEDWPKELYAALGFTTAWRPHDFVRRPR